MDMEQYVGCVIEWKGHIARIIKAVDCYEGSWFILRNEDNGEEVRVDAFDMDFMEKLPDPVFGVLKEMAE